MNEETAAARASLKERAMEEFKAFCIIAAYLALFFGALTNYRRLILAQYGISYFHYGFALIEAMIIAKVILVGQALGLGRRSEQKPLVWRVLYKTLAFGGLVMLFGVLEHVVEGVFHKESLAHSLQRIADIGVYEIAARAVMVTVAFVPFFAFWETGRVIGLRRLSAMFLSPPADTPDPGVNA